MIRARRITQVVSLLIFVLLLSLTIYPLSLPPDLVNIYMRMSPLHLFATLLNAWQFLPTFIPAIVVLAMTLLFGRFFCGWICPMGITLDATDRILKPRGKKGGRNDSKETLRWKPVKYGVLVAVLVAAYFEANLAGWLDPQSLITRTYTQVALPGFEFLSDLVFKGLRPLGFFGSITDAFHSIFKTTLYSLKQPAFHGMLATGLVFLAIAMLVYFNRRFWCRFLCPMGAILALTSKFSVFRRVVDPAKCTGCGRCVRNCRMGAIYKGGQRDYRGECIECFTCRDICPEGAVSFRPLKQGAANMPVNVTRRAMVSSIGAGMLTVPMIRLAPAVPGRSPIRPPGAGGEKGIDFFMQTCLRCGQCMRACPTNALQPTWLDSGLEGLWTPELSPAVGYCEFHCSEDDRNLCGLICPSGAILPLTGTIKQHTQIGIAVFDKNRCIPWSRGEECLCCEEHCPVPSKAIHFREETMLGDDGKPVRVKLPYVIEEECIGCGICENKCPLHGHKGIHVTGFMPQTVKSIPEETGADGPDSLLPEALAGWTAADDIYSFGPDNLFDFINGGAEIYYEYGYAAAATRDYELGDDALTVDVFRMAGPDAAYGITSFERPSGAKSAGIGTISYIATGSLAFARAEYYVKINWYGNGDGVKETKAVADKVSAIIGRDAPKPPEILKFVPDTVDLSGVTIVAGPLTARAFHPSLAEGDPAGFAAGAKGAWAHEGVTRRMVLVYASEADAAGALERIEAAGFNDSPGDPFVKSVSISPDTPTLLHLTMFIPVE